MAVNEGAGSGEPDETGSGAPDGGSPEGGSENDDKPITAKQLKAALESQKRHYEGQLSGQRAEFEAFKQGVVGSRKQEEPDPKPTRYTRAQLKAAVDAGQISQEQADDTWAQQIEADVTERATAAATNAVVRQTTKERIDADISAYRRLKPEIMENGSELREKVQAEFNVLVAAGLPGRGEAALPTQLAAIRAVLGPIDKLEKASKATRSQESHQEGGSGGQESRPAKTGNKLVDQLDSRWREHYEAGIKQGRYPNGWKDVEAELKFATPKTRQRLGLNA